MKKYKVELIETATYIIDIKAKTEAEAIALAEKHFEALQADGIEHYYNSGDGGLTIGTVYDVTNTDDPFSPLNEK